MKQKTVTTIEVPASVENFEEASQFLRHSLDAKDISKEMVSETMLIVEAMFHNILEQGIGSETILRLTCRNSLGTVIVTIGFEGKLAYLYCEDDGDISPEDRILKAYEDKIDHSYRSGYNSFQIVVRRKHLRSLLYCLIGVICAFIVYLPIHYFMSGISQHNLIYFYLLPIEKAFGNAALMIGAPVTFFSLLTNLTNTYILSERYSIVRKLQLKGLATSVFMVVIAIGMSFLLLSHFRGQASPVNAEMASEAKSAFADLLSGIIPASIFEPFESVSPIPLIVVALIVTYSFCSAGRHFSRLKRAIDVCYTVFSKMLGLVLFVFPFFFFVTCLEMLLAGDLMILWIIIQSILLILLSTLVLVVFYCIRLRIGGIRVWRFVRRLPPLLLENSRINSSIDAVPFNIRYCVRNYGMKRKRLRESLPALAQIMFDGNCYMLMCVAMLIIFGSGNGATWYNILVSAILVIFLSLGAPNQPGTFLIGTTILLMYHGYAGSSYIYIAIFFEAAFSLVQNIINVTGDIVTVAVEERRLDEVDPSVAR